MKKHVLRFRIKDKKNFEEVRKGLKTVETRAATDKYKKFEKGDILIFVCGKSRLERKIKKVKIFSSISVMLKQISRTRIMPSTSNVAEMRAAYYSYPGYKEKIKKHGLIAFWI